MSIEKLKEDLKDISLMMLSRSKKPEVIEVKERVLETTKFLDEAFEFVQMKLRLWHIERNVMDIPACEACGGPTSYKRDNVAVENPYTQYCSVKCRAAGRKGKWDEILTKEFLIEEHHNKQKSIDQITAETGATRPAIISRLARYDIKYYPGNQIHSKTQEKLEDKEYMEELYTSGKTCAKMGEIIGTSPGTVSIWLRKHGIETRAANDYDHIISRKSKAEIEILEYIKSLGIEAKSGLRKILGGQELDIVCPDQKIAIEYNGFPWHTEIFGGKDRKYHITKTEKALEKGYRLLHIWSTEWHEKKDIWKSIIAGNLGLNKKIYARKCKVVKLDKYQRRDFLKLNHLQGAANHDNIAYGLFHGDELVCCMSFGKARMNRNYQWELVRFSNKQGINVVGGASRLLKAFRNEYEGSIISYADRRYSEGDLYHTLGFKLIKTNGPGYSYFNGTLHNRRMFIKSQLSKKLESYDPEISERQNMINNGYDIVWDCGTYTFILD